MCRQLQQFERMILHSNVRMKGSHGNVRILVCWGGHKFTGQGVTFEQVIDDVLMTMRRREQIERVGIHDLLDMIDHG